MLDTSINSKTLIYVFTRSLSLVMIIWDNIATFTELDINKTNLSSNNNFQFTALLMVLKPKLLA